MAQNTTVSVPARTWTQLTNADVSAITFQNISGQTIKVKGTVGAVAPDDATGSFGYTAGTGEVNVVLSELFLGVTGVNRVYAYSHGPAAVAVSHA